MNHDSRNRLSAGVTLLLCLLGGGPAQAAPEPGEDADGPEAGEILMGEGIDWGDDVFDEGGVEEVVEPAPDKGLVKGRITTEGRDEGVIEARITVDGTSFGTRTDVDGRYALELPPGKWDLRVWSEQHFPQRIEGMVVEAGEEIVVDVAMAVDESSVLTVLVEAEADSSRAAVQMERRKRAAAVMDAVSAEEMSRTPDSSAADAMKRVVGATVIGGKYLVVRGLGGRYTTTLLQGVGVPNPEPDMPSLPLDIFPSSLLASVSVAKTATPDLPANFAGGALLLEARQYPRKFNLELDAGFSGDTVSTFEKAPRYAGGSTDWLGFDDGSRALPAGIPSDAPTSALSRNERAELGRSFGRTWGAEESTIPANAKVGLSVGDTVDALGRRLGYQASLSWGQSWEVEREHRVTLRKAGDSIDTTNFADEISGARKVKLGGLGSLAWELGPSDDISLISLYSRNVDDRAQVVRGYNSNERHYESTELYFIARQLTFNQLRGHHRFDGLGGLELDWQGNFSRIDRDEPDTRSISYQLQDDGTKFMNKDRGGQRIFTDLVDETFGAGADLTLPAGSFKPKVGFLFSQSARDFSSRRFLFEGARAPRDVLQLGPDEIFNDDTIGRYFTFDENTRVADSYTANTKLLAVYAMTEVALTDSLRVVGGARFERQVTDLAHDAPTARTPDETKGVDGRIEEDVLPSINVVQALGDRMNLRAAWGMTVARPQLRELSSASWYDLTNDRFYYGNADIRRSRIHNADLRLEYFPGTTEVLAVSVFGKVFEDPIEEVFFTAEGSSATFTNAASGWVYGVELEGRLGLYHLADALREFGLTANLTLAQSEVDMGAENALMTNRYRPLHGQSEYALNVGLLYENEVSGTTAQLLYNVFGPRLDVAGIQSLPDVFEEAFHRVDLIFTQGLGSGFDLKLAAINLLDDEETFTQGDTEVSRYRPGVGASASLSWTF